LDQRAVCNGREGPGTVEPGTGNCRRGGLERVRVFGDEALEDRLCGVAVGPCWWTAGVGSKGVVGLGGFVVVVGVLLGEIWRQGD
jgi:hypothetical protein